MTWGEGHEYSHLFHISRPETLRQKPPLWYKGYDIKEMLAQAYTEHETPFVIFSHTSNPREDLERLAQIEHQVDETTHLLKTLGTTEQEHYKHLVDRVTKLEERKDNAFVIEDKLEEDPYLKWCRDNAEKLREIHEQVGPCFLAIDIAKGEIVVAARNEDEYIAKLEQVDPETRKSLYRVHSSMLV